MFTGDVLNVTEYHKGVYKDIMAEVLENTTDAF